MRVNAIHALLLSSAVLATATPSHAQFDPTLQIPEEFVFTTPSTDVRDGFGERQSVSGNDLLIGAEFDDVQGVNAGAAYLYRRSPGGWVLDTTLHGSQSPKKGRFGSSVAIDGDVAVVGAVRDPWAGDWSGAVYVYRNMGPVWVEEAVIRASDGHGGHRFGDAVAIHGDTIVVSATGDMDLAPESGALYVYRYAHGGLWIPEQKIKASQPLEDATFGDRVRIDGDRIVTAERLQDAQGLSGVGALHVFQRTGTAWAEEATLLGSNPFEFRFFGGYFDLSGDRVVASSRGLGLNPGKVNVFERSGGGWVESDVLTAQGTHDFRGVTLEGDTLVACDDGHVQGLQGEGITTVFHHLGGTWVQRGRLFPNASVFPTEFRGHGISISGETVTVAARGPGDRGCVYAYFVAQPPSSECVGKPHSAGCTPTLAWSGFPSVTSSNEFRIQAVDLLNRKPALLFYGFAPNSVPFQGGTLCVAPPTQRIPPILTGGSASGSDCSGSLDIDFLNRIQSGVDPSLTKGARVHTQVWFRDPADPFGVGLTDALSFVIGT